MQTVKVRKVGNSRVLTIPAQIDTEATQLLSICSRRWYNQLPTTRAKPF